MPTFQSFLEKDTPAIDIKVEQTFFTGDRARMSFIVSVQGDQAALLI
jgi:hypothetical protein